MKSKTKTLPTDAVLRDMLEQAGIDSAGVQFRLLGDGMFNAVFAAETNPPVVLKIAPRPQVPVMTYERDMLATELYWYDQIRQHTEITVPDILYSDPAGNLCGAPWVVMERLPGVHRDKCPLPSAEKHRRTAEMVAQIHNVFGTGYGYVQNGLYENWADTLFVSHGVGDLAAAGISVVFPLTVLQGAIAQMVGAGAGALVSPCLGQKDYRAAGRVTKSAMAFFYTTALGITCICLLFRTPLLRLFGATAEILPYARTYFTILAAGNVFSTGFSSIIRAEGRMDYSLWIWLLPTGVNLLLDWLLIYRLHLGIAGAAWATVIAQAASFCMSVLFFTRFSCQQFRGVRADRATVGRILTLGLPTLVQMGSLSVVLVVMNGLLAPRAGTVGVAAFGYVSRLAEFALAPFSALCLAAAPIIGSSYGAGLHRRVRQTVVRTVQLGLVYAVVAEAVCYALSGALLGIFTRDPAIVQFGTHCLRRLAPALLFLPPVLTVSAYFQSVNRAKSALVTAGALPLCLCVGACLAAPLGTGAVWWAVPIAAAVCAVFCGALYIRQAGKRKRRAL